MSLAVKNMSSSLKYLCGFEEYLQLLITSDSTFFWLRGDLKGLVHQGLSCRLLTQRCYHERPELLVKGSFITEGRMTDAWSLSTLTRG